MGEKTSETAIIDPHAPLENSARAEQNSESNLSISNAMITAKSGDFVGPYKILRKLGAGGMGMVYEALDEDLNRKIALKILKTESAKPDQVDRFLMEAKAAAAINHPNIIQVFTVGKHEGNPYFAMEMVEGRDLDSIFDDQEQPLTITEVLAIMTGCVRALVIAQEHGIVHRDIKPANIMINRQGHVKVMDFGIAKATKLTTSITTEGQVLGTPDYISPEQATGTGKVDFLADMYSLGCVTYQCLTGRKPFAADTPMEVICCHVLRAPEPIKNLNPIVPAELCSIVERMMAKEPENRYQSQEELLSVLEGFLARLEEFDLPATEVQLDLGWHSQDPRQRAPRNIQVKRQAKSTVTNTQVIVGRLMNLSGRESGRFHSSARRDSAFDLSRPEAAPYVAPRWGIPHLLSIVGALSTAAMLTLAVLSNAFSDAPDLETQSFPFSKAPLTSFLPDGWELSSISHAGETNSFKKGDLVTTGIYELLYSGPDGRKVMTTVAWSSEGISPAPAASMFETSDAIRRAAKLKQAKASKRSKPVASGPIHWQSKWSDKDLRGWSGGEVHAWGDRPSVLLSEKNNAQMAYLRFDTHTGLTPPHRALKVQKGAHMDFELQVKGTDTLIIQIYSASRDLVFVSSQKVTSGRWAQLKLPCSGFRALKGKAPLTAGDSIDQIGLFLERREHSDQNSSLRIGLAQIKLQPPRKSKKLAQK